MNCVLGMSRLLSDTELDQEQQQILSMITNSSHLLLGIINGQSACCLKRTDRMRW